MVSRKTGIAGIAVTILAMMIVTMALALMTDVGWAADASTAGANATGTASSAGVSSESGSDTAFNTVDLPEGSYKPDSFSWSGGSGRLKSIDCTEIRVRDGGAYATIVFASPNYDHVKIMGKSYKRTEVGEDSSTFQVPVRLNTNMDIEGRTTAMSQPHWIPYQIYVEKKGAKAGGNAAIDTETLQKQKASMKKELQEEPPVITGFEGGEKVEADHAQYLRLFRYKDGGALIQVARSGASAGVTGDRKAETAGGSLYDQNVVNYLVLPEGRDAPAGAEKDFVIIPQGASPVYTDLSSIRALLEGMGVAVIDDGEFDTTRVVKAGTKLCVMSGQKATSDVAGKLVLLSIPLFIDRADEEQGIIARSEWTLAYGEIFGMQEEAQNMVAEAAAKAAQEQKQQRTAAVILLVGIIAAMGIIPVTAKRG